MTPEELVREPTPEIDAAPKELLWLRGEMVSTKVARPIEQRLRVAVRLLKKVERDYLGECVFYEHPHRVEVRAFLALMETDIAAAPASPEP